MSTADEQFLKKLREAFAIEAHEHLASITSGLLALEAQPEEGRQKEILETIFREAHSLKGAARAVNRSDIETICQSIESVFAAWKKELTTIIPQTAFDTLNRVVDLLSSLLEQPETAESATEKNGIADAVRELGRLLTPEKSAVPHSIATPAASVVRREGEPRTARESVLTETVRVPILKMDSLLLQTEEMLAIKLIANEHVTELKEITGAIELWKKRWRQAFVEQGSRISNRGADFANPRVEQFLNWNRSYMRSLETKVAALAKAAEADRHSVAAMVDDLLDDTKRLVLLPFTTLLEIFPKIVRDLSRDQHKEVVLALRGGEVEIDKRILAEMKDPLIHLVRNAIDHGIEKPEIRKQSAKNPRGNLTLSIARSEGNRIEIIVSDDGAGIDVTKVKTSANNRGLLSDEQTAAIDEQEALSLIFKSGVSTSANVTEISGRGLGMAIASEKIQKLGGHISLSTRPNQGTTFRILLPITLSAFRGLLVSVAGQSFVIPIANVERVARIQKSDVCLTENRETILFNDQTVPLASMCDVLGLTYRHHEADTRNLIVAVLSAGEKRIAFTVDEILNEQEVLVKNLGKLLVRVSNIAGATVLGSGKVVPILNVADILKSAAKINSGWTRQKTETRTLSLLVVDDSATSRMLLKNILESAGYKVKTAIDGSDAWASLNTQKFDVVVTDVEMPKMNGFDLTSRIREDKKLAEVPVVLVTVLESAADRERGAKIGASAYIVKSSFDQSDLLQVIKQLT